MGRSECGSRAVRRTHSLQGQADQLAPGPQNTVAAKLLRMDAAGQTDGMGALCPDIPATGSSKDRRVRFSEAKDPQSAGRPADPLEPQWRGARSTPSPARCRPKFSGRRGAGHSGTLRQWEHSPARPTESPLVEGALPVGRGSAEPLLAAVERRENKASADGGSLQSHGGGLSCGQIQGEVVSVALMHHFHTQVGAVENVGPGV